MMSGLTKKICKTGVVRVCRTPCFKEGVSAFITVLLLRGLLSGGYKNEVV